MNDFKISMKAARVNRELTAKQAAQSIGRTEKTLLNWENAVTPVNAHDFYKLCDLYKIDPDYVAVPIVNSKNNIFLHLNLINY